MKKISISLIITISLNLLIGCSSKEQSQTTLDQVGYRRFTVSKLDTGNLPLETKSDIPNDFVCIEIETIIHDKNYNELYSYGVELKDSSQGTKILKVNPNSPVSQVFYRQSLTFDNLINFNEIDTISASYLCFSPQIGLNNEIKKDITNGFLDKK